MEKKFYHYLGYKDAPLLNEVTYPHCPLLEEDHKSFLVYAENEKEAFCLAMKHIFDGLNMSRFYGKYNGERYNGIRCVM